MLTNLLPGNTWHQNLVAKNSKHGFSHSFCVWGASCGRIWWLSLGPDRLQGIGWGCSHWRAQLGGSTSKFTPVAFSWRHQFLPLAAAFSRLGDLGSTEATNFLWPSLGGYIPSLLLYPIPWNGWPASPWLRQGLGCKWAPGGRVTGGRLRGFLPQRASLEFCPFCLMFAFLSSFWSHKSLL